jgi:hypothetical protein
VATAGVNNARETGASMLQAAADRLPPVAKEKAAALASAVQEFPEKVNSETSIVSRDYRRLPS